MAENLEDMKTGEVKEQAERAGVEGADQMNKGELIDARGGATNTEHGGGQRQKDPAPRGADPSEYKDIPGNQT
jgi:Rho termination factor, N-terminal domain